MNAIIPQEKKSAIAEYIVQHAKLYHFCLSEVNREMAEEQLGEESRRTIATTLYLSAQKKFGL